MFGDGSNLELITKKKYENPFSDRDFFVSEDYEVNYDVMYFENLVCPEFCKDVIQYYKAMPGWRKAVTNGENEKVVSADQSPRQSKEIEIARCKKGDAAINQVIRKTLSIYCQEYSEVDVQSDEGYSLLEYGPGGYYTEHVDRGVGNNRILSGLVYMNDDYEGGEINFSRQQYSIKPKAGSVVLFPSLHTHIHACLPVTSGTKYAIVTWFK